jgi:hypothetical protein
VTAISDSDSGTKAASVLQVGGHLLLLLG